MQVTQSNAVESEHSGRALVMNSPVILSGLPAIKMDSGYVPAAEVTMSAILMKLGLEVPPKWQAPEIRNRNYILTGHTRPLSGAFEGIAV